jgi:hypothetical protein
VREEIEEIEEAGVKVGVTVGAERGREHYRNQKR